MGSSLKQTHTCMTSNQTPQAALTSSVRNSFPPFLMETLVILYTKISIVFKAHKVQIKDHVKLSNEETAVGGILSDHFIHAYTIPTGNSIISS